MEIVKMVKPYFFEYFQNWSR